MLASKEACRRRFSLSASTSDEPSYVEMESEVEWQETMKFLKVEFPVEFGHVPTAE
jgi:alpha-mannosidase